MQQLSNWLVEITLPDGCHWVMVKNCADLRGAIDGAKAAMASNPEAQVRPDTVKRIPPGQELDAVRWANEDTYKRYPNRIPTHEYTGGAPNRILSQPFVVPGSKEFANPLTDSNMAEAYGYVKRDW